MKVKLILLFILIIARIQNLILNEKHLENNKKNKKDRNLFLLTSSDAKEQRYVLRKRCNLKR